LFENRDEKCKPDKLVFPFKLLLPFYFCLVFTTYSAAYDLQKLQINGSAGFGMHRDFRPSDTLESRLEWGIEDWDLLLNLEMGEHTRLTTNVSWNAQGEAASKEQFRLTYGFIEHAFADPIKLRLGKFFIPFGAQNMLRRAGLATLGVGIPQSTLHPDLYTNQAFKFFPASGQGALLQGETFFDNNKIFEYSIALTLGFQDSLKEGNNRDGNDAKAITTRLRLDFNQYWRAEKSFYFDWVAGPLYGMLFSDGYGLAYNGNKLNFQAEYVTAQLEKNEEGEKQKLSQQAAYMQSSLTLGGFFTPYLRFEWVDPPNRGYQNSLFVPAFGFQWDIGAWYILKSEVSHFSYLEESTRSASSYTRFRFLFLAGF